MDAQKKFLDGQRLFFAGKHKESILAFTESIEEGGEKEITLLSRGVAYLKTEQVDRAIKDFGTVLSLNGGNFRAYFYRGIAYMANFHYDESIRDFDKTIELRPYYGAAFFARGAAYAQLGNEYEAAKNIRTAIIFSENNIQGFMDTFRLFRPQFDKAMAIMTNKGKTPSISLTEEEIEIVKNWLDKTEH
ncbi:MAG: tetratricopeptide repeat protein [Nitrospirota bacterium]